MSQLPPTDMKRILLFSLLLAPLADEALRELYESGQTYEAFLEQADRRKAMWHDNTEKAVVPDSIRTRLQAVAGTWHLLAIAVDGCSDSANTIPYLAALVDAGDGLTMRIVGSDVGRELMEAHRTPDGRPATPTVVLLDAEYELAGVFIERPAPLQEWAIAHRDSMSSGEFLQAKFDWYDQDLGRTTMHEVVELMEAAAAGQ